MRTWLLERCGRPTADLARAGKAVRAGNIGAVPTEDGTGDFERLFADNSPKNLPIIVAGARNAGISMVVRLFSSWAGIAARIEPLDGGRG